MAKPIVIEWYSGFVSMRKALKLLEADYQEELFQNGFYGRRWTIQLFKGKGSRNKNRLLRMLNSNDTKQAMKEILSMDKENPKAYLHYQLGR